MEFKTKKSIFFAPKVLVSFWKTSRLILRTMIKCHCAEVFFESILNVVKETNRPILEVAREMGAADTCTACVPDMLAFIEQELEGQLAGNTNH
ncbi:Hypothetical protein LBF_3335 [Leptospira biflexa serovar Patoc strain 'Patoc 1 (Ames)']|uniref:BFD-like [2Fe-2S]-binding domain-containing protein n=2 Tax=Leptospira biflexa TaxID=172 RepID=B0SRX8_LEPBP|nr:hypothetical protein [Leptospira biflexa]ABZ95801.1 Hypothetical protein LBF_3335 [Leptospira biflexa serovar Patoc strain 'Patoc 1 (Ames)']ABZ99513.1 Hypothetical protein LEPBI_I3453 [Leptospira biflexa serovar Patoc strain 'Patoc 1 (Paris)']